MAISIKVNGELHTVDGDATTPLLYVLSDDLGLRGPKFGCGLGQCGCCTVIVRSAGPSGPPAPVRSCVTPVSTMDGAEITTLEGLGTPEKPHPIQKAFIDEQAVQCGYCINGMIMQGAAFLTNNTNPSEADIRQALAGNLCRCGTHLRIVRAVMRAAGRI